MSKFLLIFVFIQSVVFAQFQNFKSRSEVGMSLGVIYYIGDLNPTSHFKFSSPCYSAIYRYTINPRLVIKSTILGGNLLADDAQSSSTYQINRNLSFKTSVYEFAAGLEINYLNYFTGSKDKRITPFISLQMALFKINPKANYNGEWIDLQSLGTEGQGTELSGKTYYKKVQLAFPIGIGLKASISKRFSFCLEYGLRKTFTDYIDDVSNFSYINYGKMVEINGPIAADLSNRSLDKNPYGQRGNPTTKDWYFVCNASLNIKLGNPDKCFY
ncbi:MAG: hypothetical protein HYU67_01880 [Flavobacteriia bacterium]|nr:hypothetical protein [Flavobacteriia bacterium]